MGTKYLLKIRPPTGIKIIFRIASFAAILGMAGVFIPDVRAQSAQDCGVDVFTIADSASQGSNFLASLDEYILRIGYGCNATASAGNTTLSATSMIERGQPNVISEGWIDLINEIIDPALEQGKIVLGAKVFVDGGEQGWYVPRYVLDANPEIKTVEDALKRPDLFPSPEDSSRGAIYNGAQGWGITTVTAQLYKAYDAKNLGFDLIDTGSQAGLDGTIARANERGLGWLGVYWAPNAILAKYPMVKLESQTPVDPEDWVRCMTVPTCPNPKPGSWPTGRVYTLLSSDLAQKARSDVLDYLQIRGLSNAVQNEIFLWMDEYQATGEQGVKYFLQNYPELWQAWVSDEAAEKVKASL